MTWLGPDPLSLAMPVELAAADPSELRTRAAQHRADAGAAAQQAHALRAAVVRLVPAAWLGLGSLSFAQAALLQAGSLEAIDRACTDLADALDALATRLDQARTEAQAAVDAGRQLDEEVAGENAAWNRHPEPERVDPDPARIAAQDAAARLLANRLTGASESARHAWRQAAGAFDLVAYRMPGLAGRMSNGSDGWRPSVSLAALPDTERRQLLGGSPVCLGAGWAGSGALLGPDGRRYPLVVPWVEQNGVRWTADQDGAPGNTETLDGADAGWHEIGARVGVDAFGSPASPATKAAIVTAGFAGNAPQMIGRLRPDLLPQLRWSPAGVPSLDEVPRVPAPRSGGTVEAPPSVLIRDGDRLRWVSDTSNDAGSATRSTQRQNPGLPTQPSTPAAANAVALADSGLTGLATAHRLDEGRVSAYRATFEENDDGRIRARLTLYQVRSDGDTTSVLSRDAGVATDGTRVTDPVRYRPPAAPVMRAAPEDGVR